jgi:hypothetical protein
MRTTLTSDDDAVAKLKAEARRAGRTFRAIVDETLRRGWRADAPSPSSSVSRSRRAILGI